MIDRCPTCDQQIDYNGWPNRETWAAHLWLTNEQGIDEAARAIAATSEYVTSEGEGELKDLLFGNEEVGWNVNALSDVGSDWRIDWQRVWAALREN